MAKEPCSILQMGTRILQREGIWSLVPFRREGMLITWFKSMSAALTLALYDSLQYLIKG